MLQGYLDLFWAQRQKIYIRITSIFLNYFLNGCPEYGYKSVSATSHYVGTFIAFYFHPSVSKVNMAVYNIYWANEIVGLKDSSKSTLFKQIRQGAIRQVRKHVVSKETLSLVDIKRVIQVYGSSQNLLDIGLG